MDDHARPGAPIRLTAGRASRAVATIGRHDSARRIQGPSQAHRNAPKRPSPLRRRGNPSFHRMPANRTGCRDSNREDGPRSDDGGNHYGNNRHGGNSHGGSRHGDNHHGSNLSTGRGPAAAHGSSCTGRSSRADRCGNSAHRWVTGSNWVLVGVAGSGDGKNINWQPEVSEDDVDHVGLVDVGADSRSVNAHSREGRSPDSLKPSFPRRREPRLP